MFRLWISINKIGCSVLKTSNLFENIFSFIGGEQFDMFDDGEPQMMNGAPDFMGENQFEESQVQNNHLSDPKIHTLCCFCEWYLKVKQYFQENEHKIDFICCSF